MSTPVQEAAAATGAATTEGDGLLDQIISKGFKPENQKERDRAKSYLQQFVKEAVKPGQMVSKEVLDNIEYWIASIDKKLTVQLNEVIHNPDFQRLEATWRGMHYLVHNSETSPQLKIKVMNVTKKELSRDLERATRFDLSTTFKKVYEEEFGILGGQPYGMIVGDYDFSKGPEDVALLAKMSNIAAQAHAPFVTNASPKLFKMERFTEIGNPATLSNIFDSVDYAQWESFRKSEDSRYVGLCLPKVLARLPWGKEFKQVPEFDFEEFVDGRDHDKYLWMGAAWAYASRMTAAFAEDGWFARTRGVKGGGKVEGLPVHTFQTDDGDIAMKCPTEVAITDRREFELSNLGFLPLVHAKGQDFAAFMGAQSAQKPKTYNDPLANANAELSTKLNYMLCISRFAHYLKVLARDKIGSFTSREEQERDLNDWIQSYVVDDPKMVSDEMRARKPLQAAKVEVREVPGKPGYYEAVAYLKPHFQLEALSTSMRLVAELPKKA